MGSLCIHTLTGEGTVVIGIIEHDRPAGAMNPLLPLYFKSYLPNDILPILDLWTWMSSSSIGKGHPKIPLTARGQHGAVHTHISPWGHLPTLKPPLGASTLTWSQENAGMNYRVWLQSYQKGYTPSNLSIRKIMRLSLCLTMTNTKYILCLYITNNRLKLKFIFRCLECYVLSIDYGVCTHIFLIFHDKGTERGLRRSDSLYNYTADSLYNYTSHLR